MAPGHETIETKGEFYMTRTSMDRRDFFKFAGITSAVVAGAGLVGCSDGQAKEEKPEWLPEKWDHEADIIVIGHGGAGLGAAITAYDEDLGSVVMLEAAPKELRGGNSRVCGQNLMIPEDPEEAIKYQKGLNSIYKLDDDPAKEDELYRAWAYNLAENLEWLTNLGANMTPTAMNSHEFPEVEGSEKGATCYLFDNVVGQSAMWNFLDEEKDARGIETHFGTRAVKLVRNPLTNEALGVEADVDGSAVFFKANKGVVLACGGFENDDVLMRNTFTLGTPLNAGNGTPFNRGDGFRMVAPFGAELWHMNNVLGAQIVYSGCGKDNWTCSCYPRFASKDYIYVGPNAKRFTSEDFELTARHAKVLSASGTYVPGSVPSPSWNIFGQKCFDAGDIFQPFTMGWQNVIDGLVGTDNQSYIDAGVIIKGDTIEELAQKIELDPETLRETIERYNQFCADGFDMDFKRGQAMEVASSLANALGVETEHAPVGEYPIVPIEGPYYAMRIRTTCTNTQGGPKRGADGSVIDVFGNAVPRLYAAGEFGTVYAYQYNGGANFSEAISSGRLAARSIGALAPWDAEEVK